ncbi:MAG: HlyD family efflux transporter periplasmic adaptor subunit [Rhodobacteraceae bacterium]|nr:HlyD family efflux transporter periplasmic adaptor subunit [Paracoccaceae bacterium]
MAEDMNAPAGQPSASADTANAQGLAALLGASDSTDFLDAWLALLAEEIPGVEMIVVFGRDPASRSYAPMAVWPDPSHDARGVEAVARNVISGRAAAELRDGDGRLMIGMPVLVGDDLPAFVALRLAPDVAALSPQGRQRLLWSTGWLEARFWQRAAEDERRHHEDGLVALDILAQVGAQRRLGPAGQALVTALAAEPAIERAAFGLVRGIARKGAPVRVESISGAAWFRRRGDAVLALGNAMEEALDQMGTVAWPGLADMPTRVTRAHQLCIDQMGGAAIVTAVLFDDGRPIGAISVILHDADAATPEFVSRIEAVADLLGPMLELKRRQQGWLSGRAVDALERGLRALGAQNRPSYRLAVVTGLIAVALPFVIHQPLRITTDANLEGRVQRVAVAPFNGRIAEAAVQAGDRVAAGDLLFSLDDRDLLLEAGKWQSELEQLRLASRRALADNDRAEVRIAEAQIAQAAAQLALAESQLERASVHAPIDGVVIAGDLSQMIGAPVQQGDEVFTLAPLDDFRVILEIDERDLDRVAIGSSGVMRLKQRTETAIPLRVSALTSVARLEEGRRLFRAEAELEHTPPGLRPGLEGVARLHAGEQSLAAIWTRRLRDWIRLAVWRWMP